MNSIKANRVLYFFLLAFVLIGFRIAFLATVEFDRSFERAKIPKRKKILTEPNRGSIRDRFNIPMAINRTQFNAAVRFHDIKEVPQYEWIVVNGKKKKIAKRKEYIETLSKKLASFLDLNSVEIEDLIYSQAALFPNTPCIIQKEIPEKTYYRLKMLSRKYPGIYPLRSSKRYYPLGSCGGQLIGHIGSINRSELNKVSHEQKDLEEFLARYEAGEVPILPTGFTSVEEVVKRKRELEKKAYSLNCEIGKSGIEKAFDADLRGENGLQQYEIDRFGRLVRKLPGSFSANHGKRIVLSLSSELQLHAEKLLAFHEGYRNQFFSSAGKFHEHIPNPWIKGGAIIAMLPKTGEVVALASYPRNNPNDFLPSFDPQKTAWQQARIKQYLEVPSLISSLWDGQQTLFRELYSMREHTFYTEKQPLTLDFYLNQILSPKSPLLKQVLQVHSVQEAFEILKTCKTLLDLSEQPSMSVLFDHLFNHSPHKTSRPYLDPLLSEQLESTLSMHQEQVNDCLSLLSRFFTSLKYNDDKLLFLDLLRVITQFDYLEWNLLPQISLKNWHESRQEILQVRLELLMAAKKLFNQLFFEKWREEHFSAYLKQQRFSEKKRGQYQRPYTFYLKQAQKKLFHTFLSEYEEEIYWFFLGKRPFPLTNFYCSDLSVEWEKTKLSLFRGENFDEKSIVYLLKKTCTFDQLSAPLWSIQFTSRGEREKKLQNLAAAFYPKNGYGFNRSFAYQQATTQGSLFKLITGYRALLSASESNRELNPLTIIDDHHPGKNAQATILGFHLDGKPIYRKYKGGLMPRSYARIGKVDFKTAISRSSNIYFSLLASDILETSEDLLEAAKDFGFGDKTGIELTGEFSGRLPKDLRHNRSGLYAFAIGQHAFSVTPLQTANMLSAFANGGNILTPQITKYIAGETLRGVRQFDERFFPKNYLHLLSSFGLPTTLFPKMAIPPKEVSIYESSTKSKNQVPLPSSVRNYLLEAMRKTISDSKGGAHPYRIRLLFEEPQMMKTYLKTQDRFVGKTSTAEFFYDPTLSRGTPVVRAKDIWFGAISFENEVTEGPIQIPYRWEQPELVVIVYLRYGNYGKEAAPLAASMIEKWREISTKHETSSSPP